MKNISVVLIVVFAVILTACSTLAGAATQANPTQSAVGGEVGANPNNNAPLSPASQLALGTLNLKTTAYAVTAEQAVTLLPLWEGLRSLSQSTSFSQIEYDALVKQIQDSMSPDQSKAITDMKLTQADIGRTMQALGLTYGFGSGVNANGTPIARTPGARPGGTGGTGGRGSGGGGFNGGGGFGGVPEGAAGGARQGGFSATPATQATIVARAAQRANQSNVFLESAVITFLQQLTGAVPAADATPTPGAVTTK